MFADRADTLNPVEQLPTTVDKLVLIAKYPDIPPALLFDYWVKPELLTQWWPQEVETDPRMGGAYHLAWPKMDWSLRGHYNSFEPGRQLGFTWQWDHEPHTPTRDVLVYFEPAGDGARLVVTHSTYNDSEQDQQERQGHLEGWAHFLGRLQEVIDDSPHKANQEGK